MAATLTYRKSGVNIDLADKLVDHIQKKAPAIGGFAGLFPLELDGDGPYELVACTDGVGTKLKLAFALDKHDTIGIDLVAMSVNDLVCCGAKPLIFLDYYATGKLKLKTSKKIIAGIMEGLAFLALTAKKSVNGAGLFLELASSTATLPQAALIVSALGCSRSDGWRGCRCAPPTV